MEKQKRVVKISGSLLDKSIQEPWYSGWNWWEIEWEMFIRKINQSRNSQNSSIFLLMSLELYDFTINNVNILVQTRRTEVLFLIYTLYYSLLSSSIKDTLWLKFHSEISIKLSDIWSLSCTRVLYIPLFTVITT